MKKKLSKLIYKQLNDLYRNEQPLMVRQLQSYFKAMKGDLKRKQSRQLKGLIIELETLKAKKPQTTNIEVDDIKKRLDEIALKTNELFENLKKNQEFINNYAAGNTL